MRTAISPRLATSTFEKGAMARILPVHGPRRPAHAPPRGRGPARGRGLYLRLRGPQLYARVAPGLLRDRAVLVGRIFRVLANSRVSPGASVGGRARALREQPLEGGQ